MSTHRRILFVSPYVPSLLRPRTLHFVRELTARGHRVTVAALALSERERALGESLRGDCERLELLGIPRRRSWWSCARGLAGRVPLQALYCTAPAAIDRVRRAMAAGGGEGRFDLLHVEHLRAAAYGLAPEAAPKLYDAVDCHTRLLGEAAHHASTRRARSLARLDLGRTLDYERRLLGVYHHVAVTSEADREALAALAGEPAHAARIHVVANGVDTVYFRPPDVEVEPATLVFAGRLGYHANVRALRWLLDAIMPRVWAARPDARLRVVGEDPPRAVRALAARHPERVEVTGWVPDVRPHLATATVSVAPLVYAVGVQNKVLEAMAMALPVVATPPAAAAIGPAGDRMLVVRDEVDFAAAVVRLLGDAALRRRLGTAARRYVESHHRWESAAARLADLYEEEIARFAGAAGSGRCASR